MADTLSTMAVEILSDYRRLIRRRWGPWWKTIFMPSHYELYKALECKVISHQDALLELVFSDAPKEDELYELVFFGSHGGSCRKRDNLHWVYFLSLVRERQEELPVDIRHIFHWYQDVHGW